MQDNDIESEDQLFNADTDRVAIIEGMRKSLDILAMVSMPDVYRYAWPPLFIALYALLTETLLKVRDFTQYAIGLPRGFGKTTFLKLVVLWLILFSKKRFILVLTRTQDHGNNFISDVMNYLYEPNVVRIFGDVRLNMSRDRADSKIFTIGGRTVIFAAVGANGSVRGLNIDDARPDCMVFDDIQDRSDADSEIISNKLFDWMIGTAMKAKNPSGCTFLFIANMYPTDHSILKKLNEDPHWIKFLSGAILVNPNDGSLYSVWEELQPVDQLLAEWEKDRSIGKEDIFLSEVQNDPNARANSKFDFTLVPFANTDNFPEANFIIIDPATQKENADEVSIGYFEVRNSKPALIEVISERMNPKENIIKTLELCFKHNCGSVFVEGTAYQSTLKFWFEEYFTLHSIIGIDVVELFPKRLSKVIRILRMFPLLLSEDIGLSSEVYHEVIAQAKAFDISSTKNTDGILDLLVYAPQVYDKYSEELKDKGILRALELASKASGTPSITYTEFSLI